MRIERDFLEGAIGALHQGLLPYLDSANPADQYWLKRISGNPYEPVISNMDRTQYIARVAAILGTRAQALASLPIEQHERGVSRRVVLGIGAGSLAAGVFGGAAAGYVVADSLQGVTLQEGEQVPAPAATRVAANVTPVAQQPEASPILPAPLPRLSAGEVNAYWQEYKEGYLPKRMLVKANGQTQEIEIEEGFGWRYEEVPPGKAIFRNGTLMPKATPEGLDPSVFGYAPTLLLALHTSEYEKHRERVEVRDGKEVKLYDPIDSPIWLSRAGQIFLTAKSAAWRIGQPLPINPDVLREPINLYDRKGRAARFRLNNSRLATDANIAGIVAEYKRDIQIVICAPIAQTLAGRFGNDQRTYWVLEGDRI